MGIMASGQMLISPARATLSDVRASAERVGRVPGDLKLVFFAIGRGEPNHVIGHDLQMALNDVEMAMRRLFGYLNVPGVNNYTRREYLVRVYEVYRESLGESA